MQEEKEKKEVKDEEEGIRGGGDKGWSGVYMQPLHFISSVLKYIHIVQKSI